MYLELTFPIIKGFHEVANSMTLAICKNTATKSEIAALFLGDDIYNLSLDENKHDKSDSEIESALEYG